MIVIELENIQKNYKKRVVLKEINLTIKKGETVAVVGKSGKGKSTLLNIIGLIEQPTAGRVKINETEVKNFNSKKAKNLRAFKLDYLFQNFALVDDETIEENILLGLKRKKIAKAEKKAKIHSALGKVGLENREKEKIFNLSGGEQQRVAIARLLSRNNDIILADEPTGSLDDETKKEILKNLEIIKKDENKTLVIVTHDKEVAVWCDRVIEL
jgi:putative ABC transport system ATP-binding protein